MLGFRTGFLSSKANLRRNISIFQGDITKLGRKPAERQVLQPLPTTPAVGLHEALRPRVVEPSLSEIHYQHGIPCVSGETHQDVQPRMVDPFRLYRVGIAPCVELVVGERPAVHIGEIGDSAKPIAVGESLAVAPACYDAPDALRLSGASVYIRSIPIPHTSVRLYNLSFFIYSYSLHLTY